MVDRSDRCKRARWELFPGKETRTILRAFALNSTSNRPLRVWHFLRSARIPAANGEKSFPQLINNHAAAGTRTHNPQTHAYETRKHRTQFVYGCAFRFDTTSSVCPNVIETVASPGALINDTFPFSSRVFSSPLLYCLLCWRCSVGFRGLGDSGWHGV